MTRVGIIQSNYIPWCGYFDIIAHCDKFIFLDTVQYTKNDWRNRNRIKSAQGAQWLTIPCGKDLSKRIEEVEVSVPNWAQKHWTTIIQNYSKADCFDAYAADFFDLYKQWNRTTHLSSINQQLITYICKAVLGFSCDFHSASDFSPASEKNERIVDLVLEVGGTEYISGPAARHYLKPENFTLHGLKLTFAKYPEYGPYKQRHGEFIGNLSVLDAIFNLGKETNKMFNCLG